MIVVVFFGSIFGYVVYQRNKIERRQAKITKRLLSLPDFKPTAYFIQPNGLQGVAFDEASKNIAFVFQETQFLYPFEKLIDCEIQKNGSTVFKASTTGIGFGGIGIGSTSGTSHEVINSLFIRLIFDDLSEPSRNVYFVDGEHSSAGEIDKWYGVFTAILKRNQVKA